jgi:hypothetical protein
MGFFRRHKFFTVISCLILLMWLLPLGAAYLDDPPDELQNKCGKEGRADDPRRIDRPGHLGSVLKVRLSDNGSFVDRCEFTDILYELNWDLPKHHNEFRPQLKPNAISLPKLVILYIHGWKHSASDNDYDFIRFSEQIDQLARENTDKKQVLGVSVGWNATSKIPPFNWVPFNNLTFWSKQTVADRIAQSGVITKILSSINSVLLRGDLAANQFIVVGHSFGA